MELKEAYDIMGIAQTASEEEVEQKYSLWIKKKDIDNFQEINEAYSLIKSHLKQPDLSIPVKGAAREKIEYFWDYYKFHSLIAVVLFILSIFLIHSIIQHEKQANQPPAQIHIMVFGDYPNLNTTQLNKNILSDMPEWNRVAIQKTYAPSNNSNSYSAAYLEKSMAILATDTSAVYIVDQSQFNRLAAQGIFYSLDSLQATLSKNMGSSSLQYAQASKSGDKHLYGINITNNQITKDTYPTSITTKHMIFTIRKGSKNLNNALKLIKSLHSVD